jgi:hypothetical protein
MARLRRTALIFDSRCISAALACIDRMSASAMTSESINTSLQWPVEHLHEIPKIDDIPAF